MKITSAKYYANAVDASAEPIMIKVNYENSPSRDVPTDPTNTDYINLQAWVAEGNSIQAAD
tara:strand:+ start:371 stop:553 length:183 start_codon:yes stop_codon:yes gene_type:complete